MKKIRLAVLISGSGSNLQALIDACGQPDFPARIAVVVSNKADAYGLERAKKAGIPTALLDKGAPEANLDAALKNHPADLICLAGFMRILTPAFVNQWAGRMVNIHPSLLPKHGGVGMYGERVHQSVLDSGDTESGATVHYVIPDVDRGEIILQRRVPVLPGDTPETLAARVLEQEHIAYPEAVRIIAQKLI
jgi:phosphoribosylglycinamide formyltransferase 1